TGRESPTSAPSRGTNAASSICRRVARTACESRTRARHHTVRTARNGRGRRPVSTRALGMKEHPMRARLGWMSAAGALVLGVFALPAHARWPQVAAVPSAPLFSLFVTGDTVVAGADTTVHVSIDGGVTWRHSRKPVAGVAAITAVLVSDHRLYAGTFGQGA